MLGRVAMAGLVAALATPCHAAEADDLREQARALCPADQTRSYDFEGQPLVRRFLGPSSELPGVCREAFTFGEITQVANTLFGMPLGLVLQDPAVRDTSTVPALVRGIYPVLSGAVPENRFELLGPTGPVEVGFRVLAVDPVGITAGRATAMVFQFTRYTAAGDAFIVIAYERQPDGTMLAVGEDNTGAKTRFMWKRMVMRSGGAL